MPEHTPGPWKATNLEGPWTDGGDGGCVEAVTPDGRYVRREICDYLLDTGEDGDLEEDIANALLIASAPDLLAAIESVAARIAARADSEANLSPDARGDLAILRRAIEQAKGGPS